MPQFSLAVLVSFRSMRGLFQRQSMLFLRTTFEAVFWPPNCMHAHKHINDHKRYLFTELIISIVELLMCDVL